MQRQEQDCFIEIVAALQASEVKADTSATEDAIDCVVESVAL